MSARIVVDTNVLVYAEDADEPVKRVIARPVLNRIVGEQRGALPIQVLGEFSAVMGRKFAHRMPFTELDRRLSFFEDAYEILPLDVGTIRKAVRAMVDHQLPYFDATIWASARLADATVVLSEDFDSGTQLEGVRFVNPFAKGFDLDALLAE